MIAVKVDGLQQAVESARGRLDDALLDDAAGVVERAGGLLEVDLRQRHGRARGMPSPRDPALRASARSHASVESRRGFSARTP